jgi:hypothetical protein
LCYISRVFMHILQLTMINRHEHYRRPYNRRNQTSTTPLCRNVPLACRRTSTRRASRECAQKTASTVRGITFARQTLRVTAHVVRYQHSRTAVPVGRDRKGMKNEGVNRAVIAACTRVTFGVSSQLHVESENTTFRERYSIPVDSAQTCAQYCYQDKKCITANLLPNIPVIRFTPLTITPTVTCRVRRRMKHTYAPCSRRSMIRARARRVSATINCRMVPALDSTVFDAVCGRLRCTNLLQLFQLQMITRQSFRVPSTR